MFQPQSAAADDRETPLRALEDVVPLLEHVARANRIAPAAALRVYDPYYCRGAVRRQLATLGFTDVYNRAEDFYAVKKEGRCPPHDVLLTNPPFSKDHVRSALAYAVKRKAPWLMLLPSNVYLRAWFNDVVTARDLSPPLFLCPHERYSFDRVPAAVPLSSSSSAASSAAAAATAAAAKHIPFCTIWLVGGLTPTIREQMHSQWSSRRATLARTPDEMPRRIRKLHRFAAKRAKGGKVKKMKKVKKKRDALGSAALVPSDEGGAAKSEAPTTKRQRR